MRAGRPTRRDSEGFMHDVKAALKDEGVLYCETCMRTRVLYCETRMYTCVVL